MPAWLRYTLIRVVLFAIPFAILEFLGVAWLWSALVAMVVSFCVSFIFFRGSRDAMAEQWASRRPVRTRDDVAEDEEIAAAEGQSTESRSAESRPAPEPDPASADGERRAES